VTPGCAGAGPVPLCLARCVTALAALAAALFVGGPQAQSESPALDAGLLARVDTFVASEVEASAIPGLALAIVQRGRVVHIRGFGSGGHGQPITGQTPFPIGSLTKSFTALLVRREAEAGQIELDSPVQRYLPWFRVADANASSRITVRHLLNQTSGLSRAAGMQPLLESSMASTEQLARDMKEARLNRPVGERYEYSNLNFVLLGALLEAVTRRPWAELVQAEIFRPLQMQHSHVDFESARRDGMTDLHRYWFGVPVRHDLVFLPGMASAGYLAASADDMGRYLAMWLGGGAAPGGRLLPAHAVAQMLAPATAPTQVRLLSSDFEARYAQGWFVGRFGAASDARWHLGTLPSFVAWMVLLPDTEQAIVVLINANGDLPLTRANQVLSRIPLGVVNLLHGQVPPAGPSLRRAYAVFDLLAVVWLGGVALWSWWVGRKGSWASVVTTGVVAGLLAAVPAAAGLDWRSLAAFLPDIALVVGAGSVLLTLAVAHRVVGLARRTRPDRS
jgi:CubicO group peptidase (beta-lactamase class C family)